MEVPHVKSWLPWLGSAISFGADPDGFLRKHQAVLGDAFSLVLNGQKSTFFLNAHDFAEVFRNAKTLSGEHVLPEVGSKIFGFDAKAYELVQHELEAATSRMMRGKALEPLTRQMQLELEKAFLELPTEAERKGLTELMFDTLFPSSTRALFGDGVYSDGTLRHYLNLDKPLPLILGNFPAFFFPAFKRAQRALRELMASSHPNQSEVMDARHDLWKQLESPEEDHGAYDVTVLWAAQANTIPAAVWTLYYVMRDPEIKRLIVDEVRSVMAAIEARTPNGMPLLDTSHLAEMERLDSCIWEALRLTTATIVMREALEPTTLSLFNGETIEIEKGERVVLYARMAHMDPDIYESPNAFRYDRFLASANRQFTKAGKPVKFHLLPFGGGKSICPGRYFAINEFKLLVAMLIQSFDFEVLPSGEPELDFTRTGLGNLPPKSDIMVKYRYRGDG